MKTAEVSRFFVSLAVAVISTILMLVPAQRQIYAQAIAAEQIVIAADPLQDDKNISGGEASDVLNGQVRDALTLQPLAHVYVHLDEINRKATTDREGTFRFSNLQPGQYTIYMHRLGYRPGQYTVLVNETTADDVVQFNLFPQTFESDEVIVTDQALFSGGNLGDATQKVTGNALRKNLGSTISATLNSSLGAASQSLGPAASRPVIRGLTGERVMVLEDGGNTGDVSSIAFDHAVTIDPFSAKEIEILRGPSALRYGGNAVGGIVNVVSDRVPTTIPTSTTGAVSFKGDSVNEQFGGAIETNSAALGGALRLNLSGRAAGDLNTPGGSIPNTYLQNTSNSIGYSRIGNNGYFGGFASAYLSNYGVPPDPQGGHPNGVDIEMMRYQVGGKAERLLDHSFFKLVESDLTATIYYHRELESSGAVGSEFAQNSIASNTHLSTNPYLFFTSSSMGVDLTFLDYKVRGSRSPDSRRFQSAVYAIQRYKNDSWEFSLGNRVEFTASVPEEERTSPRIGEVRNRSHTGLASSVSFARHLSPRMNIGSSVLYSHRSPSLEELYSEGPHLAAYTFEIGNPDLKSESGLTAELFLRRGGSRLNFEISAFGSRFFNFIFPVNTGQESIPFPDLFEYQFRERPAFHYGAEAFMNWNITQHLEAGGRFSYVLGSYRLNDDDRERRNSSSSWAPLPLIPPLSADLFAEVSYNSFSGRATTRFVSEQNRIDEFETSTSGYNLVDFQFSYHFDWINYFHTLNLGVDNIFDTSYRNHTSIVKDIFPEPGRNVSLLYRVYF